MAGSPMPIPDRHDRASPPPRLGMLTPSSNTVLEPMTAAMLAGVPGVTAHFQRIRVREDLDGGRVARPVPARADGRQRPSFLADAQVGSICWNGTSAGWLGFRPTASLCRGDQADRTGMSRHVLGPALNEILALTGARRIAFVTPYLDDIQAAINANYAAEGFEVVADRHLGDPGNYSFCSYGRGRDRRHVPRRRRRQARRDLDPLHELSAGPGAVRALEEETGVPIYDSVATSLWKSMKLAGADPRAKSGAGAACSTDG